jgi:hypothetical protein
LVALSDHARRYADNVGAADLTPFESRVFSQNGEDGVISEILSRAGVTERWFVEFGIGSGHEGNCVLLADAYGWEGLFCEPDPEFFEQLAHKYQHNPRIRTAQVRVAPTNVERIFEQYGVPTDLDVLSIDVDTIDFWIWRAIKHYRPKLVVIEYNASLSPDRAEVFPYDENARWDGTAFYGSSLGAYRRLAAAKGYQLVHTDLCGINAFFVRGDLSAKVGVAAAPIRVANFGLTGMQMPPDPQHRAWQQLDDTTVRDDE